MRRSKRFLYINLACCLLLLMVLICGFFNRYNYEVTNVSITTERLPDGVENFKLVAFSDAHLVTIVDTTAVDSLVSVINQQHADIVCFLGDMTSYNADELVKYKHVLSKIKAKYGIYAILGNHDYGIYQKWNSEEEKQANMNTLIDTYNEMGWHLLMNDSEYIVVDNDTIIIAGTENWGVAERFPKLANINKTLKNVDSERYYTILMAHDPNYWDQQISKENPTVDLTLSGHTHGGQMGFKLDDDYYTIFGLFSKYSHGLHSNDRGQKLFISIGSGEVGYPGRIGLNQEVAVLRLQKEKH